MAADPLASRGMFEKALDLFREQNNATGSFLSWACIIDTFNYLWDDFSPFDRWIGVFDALLREHPNYPSPEIEVRVAGCMLSALANRQPGCADLPAWAERVQRIVVTNGDIQLRMVLGSQLVFYYVWIGDFSKIAPVVDALRPAGRISEFDPLTKLSWYAWKALYSWFVADWEPAGRRFPTRRGMRRKATFTCSTCFSRPRGSSEACRSGIRPLPPNASKRCRA